MDIGNTIKQLRKDKGINQDALAEHLLISVQAVSKWECGQSCPDITLLPHIAQYFGVSLDYLLTGAETQIAAETQEPAHKQKKRWWAKDATPASNSNHPNDANVDWPDDDVLRVVQFVGRKMLTEDTYDPDVRLMLAIPNCAEDLSVHIWGSADIDGDIGNDASAGLGLNCGNVGNDATAGLGLNCGNVGNDAAAGVGINCGNIDNNASAGAGINCGDIGNDASAGGGIGCGDIGNDASAGGGIGCGDIGNDASAGGDIDCDNIDGNATAGGNIDCDNIGENASAGGKIDCDDIGGDATVQKGDIRCRNVAGDIHCDSGSVHTNK